MSCLSNTASGKDKPGKKAAAAEAVAVIGGTVFRADGFAVAGAEVTITPMPDPANAEKQPIKKIKSEANNRGEFAARVPAIPMSYRVDVKVRGFNPQSRDVHIEGEQRKELNFLLEPVH